MTELKKSVGMDWTEIEFYLILQLQVIDLIQLLSCKWRYVSKDGNNKYKENNSLKTP